MGSERNPCRYLLGPDAILLCCRFFLLLYVFILLIYVFDLLRLGQLEEGNWGHWSLVPLVCRESPLLEDLFLESESVLDSVKPSIWAYGDLLCIWSICRSLLPLLTVVENNH